MIRKSSAKDIIEKNVAFAMGAGIVPIPLVDFGALVAILLKMVQSLAAEYNIQADHRKVRNLIIPLLKSPGVTSLAIGGLGSLSKFVPGLAVVGTGATVIMIGALTYATGKVFALHFEKGGDLTNFKISTQKKIFLKEYHSGKKVIRNIQKPAASEVEEDPLSSIPIYLILKPNLGANGKVYLKTYYKGKRPEKYIGTCKALEEKYNTNDLQSKEAKILDDYRELFIDYIHERFDEPQS